MAILDFEKISNQGKKLYIKMEEVGKVGMYETDLQKGTFKASPYFQKMFDLPRQKEYSVLDFQALLHPDDLDWVMQLFAECIDSRQPFDCEYRCLINNEVIYVRSRSKIVYDKKGNALKAIGVKQDISEQKLSEQQYYACTQKLLKTEEATSIIAHDLRAPIGTIHGILSLMKENVRKENQYFLDLISALCDQSLAIIEDILELNLVEHPEFILKKNLQPLAPVIVLAINNLQSRAKEKNIRFVLDQDIQVAAAIDEKKIQRVLNNLLSNAIKFSYSDSRIEIRLYKKKDEAVIEIQDHGTGMDEEQQKNLFTKFSKTRRLGTQGEPSFGLGMSIVQKLVQLHHGQISVKSELQQGTTIRVALPSKK